MSDTTAQAQAKHDAASAMLAALKQVIAAPMAAGWLGRGDKGYANGSPWDNAEAAIKQAEAAGII